MRKRGRQEESKQLPLPGPATNFGNDKTQDLERRTNAMQTKQLEDSSSDSDEILVELSSDSEEVSTISEYERMKKIYSASAVWGSISRGTNLGKRCCRPMNKLNM